MPQTKKLGLKSAMETKHESNTGPSFNRIPRLHKLLQFRVAASLKEPLHQRLLCAAEARVINDT